MNEWQAMSHERDGGMCWCSQTHNGWDGRTLKVQQPVGQMVEGDTV